MKICWDNLENLKYSKKTKKWYGKGTVFIYKEKCPECRESFLGRYYLRKNQIIEYCSIECADKNNKGNLGRILSEEHRKKIGKSNKGRIVSKKTRKKISNKNKGRLGENKSNFWKGGVTKKNLPLYDTYAYQIEYAEEVRRNKEDKNILEVKCTYCGKWYIPKLTEIKSRVLALNGNVRGEYRLYCSNECKNECPIYRKIKYSAEENDTKKYSREVQPELRQLVFKRDNWICQKCDSIKSLHCHHITGVELNPIESADVDNCITYCKGCHNEVHKQKGCNRNDYKRKKCIGDGNNGLY